MDIGQLFARLTPKTVHYASVRGGGPELTANDISAALSFVPKGLGRVVIEAIYWPESTTRKPMELRNAVITFVMPELIKQAHRLDEARLDLQLIQATVQWSRRGITFEQQRALQHAQEQLCKARARAWPRNTVEHLPILVQAIVSELSMLMKCPTCFGRRGASREGIWIPCSNCAGEGHLSRCDRHRALSIHCDQAGYVRRWKVVYEWMYQKMLDSCYQALGQFQAALGKEEAA